MEKEREIENEKEQDREIKIDPVLRNRRKIVSQRKQK